MTHERDQFRKAVVMLLASRDSQYVELTNRVAAFQKYSDALEGLKENVENMVNTAKKEIEPTTTLCEGLGTVLDKPGTYMYDMGLDEEWKAMQDEARKTNEADGAPSSQLRSRWSFA